MFDSAALIESLPEQPGVYRMVGAEGELLYVGKAKNLKRRVASYFQRSGLSPRISVMVSQVGSVEITVTRSEAEALLLENNLIKGLAPKYNIIFRDDKSYPYIEVSGDEFPRIGFHRGSFDKASSYFGPFPSAAAVRDSIQLLQRIFLLRTCENPVFLNRSRPCLLHQIKRCSAPCVGLIAREAYRSDMAFAELFLKGRHNEVIAVLTQRMHDAAGELDFERAAVLRDQIRTLQKVLHRTYVSSDREEDVDVVCAVAGKALVCINLAMVRGGRHLGDHPMFPSHAQNCTEQEALTAFLGQHYHDHPVPARILINCEPAGDTGAEEPGLPLARPRTDFEREWVEMAVRNAGIAIAARSGDVARTQSRLDALQAAIGLAEAPARIECFDVSHTAGEAAVASCVVFSGGRMKKAEYRRYNVSGITPGDDYAALKQVLVRRYEKVAAGEGVRPDMILIDGGKGQLGVAWEVLVELGLETIPLVGVAKGPERRPGAEELVFHDARAPLRLGPGDAALQLIQEIRDEAHRFAVVGHRAKRAGARRGSALDGVPGIGPARRKRLLAQFGGLQGLTAATVEDLCRVEGISRRLAEQIHSRFH